MYGGVNMLLKVLHHLRRHAHFLGLLSDAAVVRKSTSKASVTVQGYAMSTLTEILALLCELCFNIQGLAEKVRGCAGQL
jgi:hypothetical protein